MRNLNETAVLNYYLQLMDEDKIDFLKGRKQYSIPIRSAVETLRDAEGMNNRINAAKDLWKLLFEAAMTRIDPDKRGYDKLFKYFDQYVNFEELIFASDSFYRDHTLHSLWVYFLGEYIIKHEEFSEILCDMNVQGKVLQKQKNILESLGMNEIFGSIIRVYGEFITQFDLEDSIMCVAAITHDLGYPLKKIEKINKCIKEVLPFFSINNYDEFNFSYSEIQQNFITSFIEFLSDNLTFAGSEKEEDEAFVRKVFELSDLGELKAIDKEELLKLNSDELARLKEIITLYPRIEIDKERRWAYSRDFEDYKHGIMSAFLLMKNVNAFHNIRYRYYDNMNMDYKKASFADIMPKLSILRAISGHTNDNQRINGINHEGNYLILIDEIEEFSRISRANQNREYITEFCKTDIYMGNSWFNVDFTFENDNIANLDPERAFKGKCDRFLNLFDIRQLSHNLKVRLRCIGKLPYDNNIYTLEIAAKYAKIMVNDVEMNIPQYLKSKQLYTREEYEMM